ncbi:hypothetical protein [Acrocarpospora pleiomorpha]|uniref:hypothetical protein n=1 Tax=Acrocarpospora pleiomorpha TaxID=90975 RepID=UPI0012D36CA5|nr:hypothetical protein [Acrocarpospora pleiomorpha]
MDLDGQIVALHRHPTAEVDPRKRIRTYAYLDKQAALGARDVLLWGEDWQKGVPSNPSGPPLRADQLPKLTEGLASAYTERVLRTNRDALRKLVTEVLRNPRAMFSCRIDAGIEPRLVMWGLMDLLDGVVGVGDSRYWTFSTDESDDLGRDLPRFVFLDQWKVRSLESAHKRIDLTNITRFADDPYTHAASHLVEAYWGSADGVAKLRAAAKLKETGNDERRIAALLAYAQKVTVVPTTGETTSRDMTPKWEESYEVVGERSLAVGGDILDYEPQFTAEQEQPEHAQLDASPDIEAGERDPTIAAWRWPPAEDAPRHPKGKPAYQPPYAEDETAHSPYAAGSRLGEVFRERPPSFGWAQIGDGPPSEPTTPAPHARSGRPLAERAPAPGGNAPPLVHPMPRLVRDLLQAKDARTVHQFVHAMATSAHHEPDYRKYLQTALIEHRCFHDFFSQIDGVDVETEIEQLVVSAFLAADRAFDESAVKKAAGLAAMTGMPDVVIATLARLTGEAGGGHARIWLDLVVKIRSEQSRRSWRKSRQQGTARSSRNPDEAGGSALSRGERARSILERVVLIGVLAFFFAVVIAVAIYVFK